jgi:acyl-CoA thioesterase FadM
MPRIKLHEQAHYEFSFPITVEKKHLSAGNHLGADNIPGILHQTVADVLRRLGLQASDLGDGKTGVLEDEALVNFRAEAFLGDALLIEAHVDEAGAEGFRIFYRMTRSGALIVLAESGLIGYDRAAHVRAPIPGTFGAALARYRQA